jgi:hypothetical protein
MSAGDEVGSGSAFGAGSGGDRVVEEEEEATVPHWACAARAVWVVGEWGASTSSGDEETVVEAGAYTWSTL